MKSGTPLRRFLLICLIVSGSAWQNSDAATCVWKVTAANGGTLYLGGSVHALRSADYPLPAPYLRALDASSRVVFETDLATLKASTKSLVKAGRYPKGDSLKNHVDPRTYSYIRRFFALQDVAEQKFTSYRPWLIAMLLASPPSQNSALGVEQFLKERAAAKHKPITGLESASEHVAPFSSLSDRQSEALLLIHFISLGAGGDMGDMLTLWRQGNADALERQLRAAYQDLPAFTDRLITARNRRWIPKIEAYLQSGQTYFVVAGAGHFGGREGVVALLRARGYTIEQW